MGQRLGAAPALQGHLLLLPLLRPQLRGEAHLHRLREPRPPGPPPAGLWRLRERLQEALREPLGVDLPVPTEVRRRVFQGQRLTLPRAEAKLRLDLQREVAADAVPDGAVAARIEPGQKPRLGAKMQERRAKSFRQAAGSTRRPSSSTAPSPS